MNTAPAFDALDRPPHLLLVDDDDRIRELLKKYLSQAGAWSVAVNPPPAVGGPMLAVMLGELARAHVARGD